MTLGEPEFRIPSEFSGTVLRSGIVLRNGMPVLDSIPPHKHLYAGFLKAAYGSYLLRRTVRIPDKTRYGVIHSVWCGGYYHWLLESLPRIVALEQQFGNRWLPIVPPYKNLQNVYEDSLIAMGYESFQRMPGKSSVKAVRLVIAGAPPLACFSKTLIQEVRERILDRCDTDKIFVDTPFIYVSRAKARARKVANENQLWRLLKEKGFRRVFLEELSFAQQVTLFKRAEIVIGQHGAGLSNILFMPNGSKVLELQRKLIGNHRSEYGRVRKSYLYFNGYHQIALFNRCAHQILECECSGRPRKIDIDDIVVDIGELRNWLEQYGI